MKNPRGAGRKARISEEEFELLKQRISDGESVSDIASEYGISRQAIYKRMHSDNHKKPIIIDYTYDDGVSTRVTIDVEKEEAVVTNFGDRISSYAFGLNLKPTWRELSGWLEQQLIEGAIGHHGIYNGELICSETRRLHFSLDEAIEASGGRLYTAGDSADVRLPIFEFDKRNILYSRSDTDGFQLKAMSHDRRWFVKAQAIISGVELDDWAVEIIASDLCNQLGIKCVKQAPCTVVYGGRCLKGVYSENFEMDGYTFISFERLVERHGISTRDQEFVKLGAIEKLKWCAERLAEVSSLSYEDTLAYMLDLALVDCLVGNVDRHTRNFGLFYNAYSDAYEIPPLFDNGMGLFEHDYYKANYKSFDEAMNNVYVAPYGEDPFDMLRLLDAEFDLLKKYPGLSHFSYHSDWSSEFADEYMKRIISIWQR